MQYMIFYMQVRWELQGLDDMLKPSQFSLDVNGALYSDRRGPRTRLKGQLQMSISFVLPPVLGLVPQNIRRDVAESVRPSTCRQHFSFPLSYLVILIYWFFIV